MTTIKEIHTRTATYSPASFMLPDATAEYTASGSVLVFPLILPAIIAVAPNSPNPLAKASTAPEITPGQAIGSCTFQKIFHGNHTGCHTVLVQNDGHVGGTLSHFKQKIRGLLVFMSKQNSSQYITDIEMFLVFVDQQILHIQHADDIVGAFFIDS